MAARISFGSGQPGPTGLFGYSPSSITPGAGHALSALYSQPAGFAQALANSSDAFSRNYGSYAGAMGGLGRGYADAMGAYSSGLGSLATARGNERSNLYGANAMAEAARQGALANIGQSALGAYGSASNAALAAWAANQQAYNRSAADMHVANQQAMGNLGVSRNSALASLGNAYSGLGRAQVGAEALAGLSGGSPGGSGFVATGPDGKRIAFGSYPGATNRGGASTPSRPPDAYSALTGLQAAIANQGDASRLGEGAAAGRQQLDSQHYSSRMMPSQMMDQTLGGLMALQMPAYGQINAGMNQFYDRTQFDEAPYQSLAGMLNTSYGGALGGMSSVQSSLASGLNNANRNVSGVNNQISGLWDRSFGNMPEFQSPAQREIARRGGAIEQQRSRDMDELSRMTRMRDLYATQRPSITAGDMRRDPTLAAKWLQPDIDRVRQYV